MRLPMKSVECSAGHVKTKITGRDENDLLLLVEEHNNAVHRDVDKQTRVLIVPYIKDEPDKDETALLSPDYKKPEPEKDVKADEKVTPFAKDRLNNPDSKNNQPAVGDAKQASAPEKHGTIHGSTDKG